MGVFGRFFSKPEPRSLPEDFDGLLGMLAEQRRRIDDAKRIAKLSLGLLESAVRAGQGVNFCDASGPGLVTAELSASDARALAKSGITVFCSEASKMVNEVESALEQQARAKTSVSVGRLLAIMAKTGKDTTALREAAGYFLIERLGTTAETAVESALEDADANIRFQAAHVLRFFLSGHAVDRLIVALKDPDGDVRAMVTRALALQKDKRAVSALLEAAENDALPGVRQQARVAADALQAK